MSTPAEIRRTTWTILALVLLALAIRIAVIPFQIGELVDPARDHWNFGWEEGRIARSITTGKGFSSPLFGETGATSWSTPVYPCLLAGVFRLFGIYTYASAWVILCLNCLFSALTCIPIYFIAQRCFGRAAALWASWIWVFFPYAIYFASGEIWGECLDTLMMALVLWCTLAMEEETNVARWAGYGLLWGLAALANAMILSTFPFMLGWLAWRRHRRAIAWHLSTATTVVVLMLTVTPWLVRNYSAFGRFIPFRGTFWMVFWEGNTGDTSDLYPDWSNPAHNDTEMEQYRRLGEMGYVGEKRRMSRDFLRRHPGLFLRLTLMRFTFTWTGFWSLRSDYLAGEPFAFANIGFRTTLTVLMLAGMRRAYRLGREFIVPFVLVLFSYPVVYYVTHPGMQYQLALDPLVVIFIGVLAAGFVKFHTETSRMAQSVEP
jgi:4-amino-4-deoxy-L-arabinose transferase-like glycosyltransferase